MQPLKGRVDVALQHVVRRLGRGGQGPDDEQARIGEQVAEYYPKLSLGGLRVWPHVVSLP